MGDILHNMAKYLATCEGGKILSKDNISWVDICLQAGKSEQNIPTYIFGENKGVFRIEDITNLEPGLSSQRSSSYVSAAQNIHAPDRKYICKIYSGKHERSIQFEKRAHETLNLEHDYQSDINVTSNMHYFFTPYIPGTVLTEICVGTLTKQNKIAILLNIIREVKKIHSKMIVHCDLRTDNIIVHPDLKKVSLIDYGCSHIIPEGQDKVYSEFVFESGKARKDDLPDITPELNEKKCYVGFKSDIFFIGNIINFLKLGSDTEDKFKELIDAALSRNMEDRPTLEEIDRAIMDLYDSSSVVDVQINNPLDYLETKDLNSAESPTCEAIAFPGMAVAIELLSEDNQPISIEQSIVSFSQECDEIFIFTKSKEVTNIKEQLDAVFPLKHVSIHVLGQYKRRESIKNNMLNVVYQKSKSKFVLLLKSDYKITVKSSELSSVLLTSNSFSLLVDCYASKEKIINRSALIYNISDKHNFFDYCTIGTKNHMVDVVPITIDVAGWQTADNKESNLIQIELIKKHLHSRQYSFNQYNLAMCCQKNKDFHIAKYHYQEYIKNNDGLRLFEAYYNLAECCRELGEDWNILLPLYEKSLQYQARAEPLIKISDYHRANGNKEIAFALSRSACELSIPEEFCFLDFGLYDHYRWMVLCVNAWKKDYEIGLAAAKKALQSKFASNVDVDNMSLYEKGWM